MLKLFGKLLDDGQMGADNILSYLGLAVFPNLR